MEHKSMGIAAAILLVLAFSLVVPVSAVECGCIDECTCGANDDDVVSMTTGVSVDACGDAPIIKAKFEKEFDGWESGDSIHEISGSQFLPVCIYGSSSNIEIYTVATDNEGKDDIANVYYRVTAPCAVPALCDCACTCGGNGCEICDGDAVIAEGCMGPADVECGYSWFAEADSYDMVAWNEGYDIEELEHELCYCPTASIYGADFDLGYCLPAGEYKVEVWALDKGGLKSEIFSNYFTMVRFACCEYDFSSIDWGNVKVNQEKVVPGDNEFKMNDGYPTVRNLGNIDIKINVKQSDLFLNDLSLREISCCDYWQVGYDAKLVDADKAYFYPEEWVELPGIVERCNDKGICFSIKILDFIEAGDYSGTVYLECTDSFLNPCGIDGNDVT